MVDFEVTGVNDRTRFGGDCQRRGIDNRVGDMHPFYFKISDFVDFSLFNWSEIAFVFFESVFVKFVRYHSQRERCSVDRKLELFEKVWHGTDVIFMGVGNDDTVDLVFDFADISEIGYQNIYTVHIFTWKTHPYIDDDCGSIGLHDHKVTANFSQSAQRRDFDTGVGSFDVVVCG